MYCLNEDDEKYNTLCDKFSADVNKEFDGYSVYNKATLKTKIRSYSIEATYFHNYEMRQVSLNQNFLAAITINSALRKIKCFICKRFLKNAKTLRKDV